MNEALFIVSIVAICLSIVALIMGCIAISVCVGLKNSTHTIQWKTLENPFQEAEGQIEEEIIGEPRKAKSPEDFNFMEDVAEQNGF